MKKIFTLIAALAATVTMQAQQGDMNFVGNSNYESTVMNQTISGSGAKDTLVINDDYNSITLPSMSVLYFGQTMTIPSLTFKNLVAVENVLEHSVYRWNLSPRKDTISVMENGTSVNKVVNISSLYAEYTKNTGTLYVTVKFQYGSMPGYVTFTETGYYTKDNAWKLVGCGTSSNPYRLLDATDFKSMAKNISATNSGKGEFFQVMDSIDFTGVNYAPIAYTGAITLAKATVKFAGTFDGNNKSIKNLTFKDSNAKCAGLFGTVDSAGVVKNVIIDKSCSFSGSQYIGSIAGMLAGTVQNCKNNANVTAVGTAAAGIVGNVQKYGNVTGCFNNGNVQAATYAAGIAAMTIGDATFDNDVNNGNIKVVGSVATTGKATAAQHVAGIVGGGAGACKVTNCTNSGSVVNKGFDSTLYPDAVNELKEGKDGNNAGGIVGYTTAVYTITGCNNFGTVTSKYYAGGILGNTTKATTINNCVNKGVVTCGDAATKGYITASENAVVGEDNIVLAAPVAADVNGDGNVDINDVNSVISVICGENE